MDLDKQVSFANNEQLLAFNNLDVERIRKKVATSEKRKTRKNTLVNMSAIAVAGKSQSAVVIAS